MQRRTIDEATARKIAVQVGCDPRTVKRVVRGEIRSFVGRAIERALVDAGLIIRIDDPV